MLGLLLQLLEKNPIYKETVLSLSVNDTLLTVRFTKEWYGNIFNVVE